jgi:DNA-binding transcriptional LysR family regulator
MGRKRSTLREVWRWLPVFRSVAEVENVSRAARALDSSPPAVSRAIKSLEDALGRKLFDRHGRRIILNSDGRALLAAYQRAEAHLGEVIAQLSSRAPIGSVRLAGMGQYGRIFLVQVTRLLAVEAPDVDVSIVHLEPDAAIAGLLDRSVDIFLGVNIVADDRLVATKLAELEMGVYVGRTHPLFKGPQPGAEQILSHGFVVQRRPSPMKSIWPKGLARKVTLTVDSQAVSMEALLAGSHVAVVERIFAGPYVNEGRLRELTALPIERASLIMLRRADERAELIALLERLIRKVVSG